MTDRWFKMKASDALARLKQAVNIKYHVGPAAAEAITKACMEADTPKKTAAVVKKTNAKSE